MFISADIDGDGLISVHEWNILHSNSLTNMHLNKSPQDVLMQEDDSLLVLSDDVEVSEPDS